jgi:thiazole synthase ThiGH ThiG subunit
VAIRRVNIGQDPKAPSLLDVLPPTEFTILPNTAGCYNAKDAVYTLQMARELLNGHKLVKLEVLGDETTLFPHMPETLIAAETLVRDGFDVMVYCSDDPIQAKILEEIGCVAVMPLASLIGSGMGILNPWNLSLIIEQATVPVLVDAGVGTASDAAIAMELGCDGVLMNSAIAGARDPVRWRARCAWRCRPGASLPRRTHAAALRGLAVLAAGGAHQMNPARPGVLVFSGLDPGGGAGIAADIWRSPRRARTRCRWRPRSPCRTTTACTKCSRSTRACCCARPRVLAQRGAIHAVKIGIPGQPRPTRVRSPSARQLRERRAGAAGGARSGAGQRPGDALARATRSPRWRRCWRWPPCWCRTCRRRSARRCPWLLALRTCCHRRPWRGRHRRQPLVPRRRVREWRWPRLEGEFHGSGCTLAAAIAARLALGDAMFAGARRGPGLLPPGAVAGVFDRDRDSAFRAASCQPIHEGAA